MGKKEILVVLVVFVLAFVSALGVDGVELVSPTDGVFVSGDKDSIGFSFNYTGDNATASCELFIEDVGVGVDGNVLVDTNVEIFSNASLSEGANDWYVNCTSGVGVKSSIWVLNVDNVGPTVELVYPINADYGSLSRLDFSISDVNLSACWYSVNSSVNVSVSCSVNVTGLVPSEGSNSWTVYANDSVGNENSDSVSFDYDTTDPVASASCSPSTVEIDENVSCSCSGTDGGSGIDSSSTTEDTSPDTSSAGSFDYECSVTDNVGNTDSDTDSYTVESASEAAATTTETTTTETVAEVESEADDDVNVTEEVVASSLNVSELEDGYEVALGEGENVSFEILGEEHVLVVDNISSKSVNVTISSEPISFKIFKGKSRRLDFDEDGVYDLKIELKDLRDDEADFVLTSISDAAKGDAGVLSEEENGSLLWLWIVLGLAFVGGVGFVFKKKGRKFTSKKKRGKFFKSFLGSRKKS